MIGHHDCNVKLVLPAMIVAAGTKHDIPRPIGKNPSEFCHKRDEVRREVSLQMRQVPSIGLHSKILSRVSIDPLGKACGEVCIIPKLGNWQS